MYKKEHSKNILSSVISLRKVAGMGGAVFRSVHFFMIADSTWTEYEIITFIYNRKTSRLDLL